MFPQTKYEVNSLSSRILDENAKNAIGKRLASEEQNDHNISEMQPHECGWTEIQLPFQDKSGYSPKKTESVPRLNKQTIKDELEINMRKKALGANWCDDENDKATDTLTQDEWDLQFHKRTSVNGDVYGVDMFEVERSQPKSDRQVMQKNNLTLLQKAIGADSYATPKNVV